MATSGRVIEHLAEVSGLLPSTVERVLRPLRADGMVPMGEKGRAQKQGHYEPEHLANVLLAFAGTQPSEGAEVAKTLGSMVYGRSFPAGAEGQFAFGTTLHSALSKIIDEGGKGILAAPPEVMLPSSPGFAPFILSGLRLSLTMPRRGKIAWSTNTSNQFDVFTPSSEYTITGTIYREAILDRLLIWAACELWADALDRRRSASPSFSGNPPSGETSENQTATSGPARDTNAAALSDQPAQTELDGGPQPHLAREREKSQPSSNCQAGHSHQHRRSDVHDASGDGGAYCAAA